MLALQNLSHTYGSKTVLSHLSTTLEAGGFYAVMGMNGCGKTTLLRCCAGLLQPTEGQVLLHNRPLSDYPARKQAQHMAYLGQQPPADFEFTAYDLVMMARNPYQRPLQGATQKDRTIVEQALRKTHTWHLRHALPKEMSGGEQRRVMLARTLAQQTPLMLLDEPLANLDLSHQFEIMELLRDINLHEGKTILMALHHIEIARRYCPQLILLHEGRILFQGNTLEGLSPARIHTVFGINATLEANGTLTLSPNKRN
ncbi:MAG: ABC transporter ATP-binding protein [Bacteroidales bacterium]|nr:ABC transporter ATP-binding protein [Bacteroidales bacterium]